MTRSSLVVAAAAVALFLLLAGPALGTLDTLDTHLLGVEYTDHHGTRWFYWFADQVVREGQSPLWTDLQFHPYGKDVYSHTGANLVDALLAVPFRAVFGPVVGHNLFVLAGIAAATLSSRHLATVFTDDRQALLITLPMFLSPASPAVDAGDPDTAPNNTDGTTNDQGAYGGPDGDW